MSHSLVWWRRVAGGCLLVAWHAGCGGGGAPAAPSPGGGSDRVITIGAAGVSPSSLTVPAGSRVTFVNNDTRRHNMTSDPHPDHADCPEINAVGVLEPGQSRETGNLVTPRRCGYHDHEQPANAALRGTIVIQ